MKVRLNPLKIKDWDSLPLSHRVMLKIIQDHGGEMEEKELEALFEKEMARLTVN